MAPLITNSKMICDHNLQTFCAKIKLEIGTNPSIFTHNSVGKISPGSIALLVVVLLLSISCMLRRKSLSNLSNK